MSAPQGTPENAQNFPKFPSFGLAPNPSTGGGESPKWGETPGFVRFGKASKAFSTVLMGRPGAFPARERALRRLKRCVSSGAQLV